MMRALIVVSLLVHGCGSGTKGNAAEPEPMSNRQVEPMPPTQPAEETTMAAMERFTRDMCACASSDCATLVSERMKLWSRDLMKKRQDDESPRLSEAEQQRYTEIGTQMAACMTKAMGAGNP